MAKMITVDEHRCVACKACVVECALAHASADTLAEAIDSGEPMPQPRMHVESTGEFPMPVRCRNCADAACIAVCPKEALHRYSEEGPVLLDDALCISCGFCVLACPFGAIDLSITGKGVVKCDLCAARTEVGELPACVSACPTAALKYEELEPLPASPCQAACSDTSAGTEDSADRPDNGDTVCCIACGQAVGPRKRVDFVRKKLAERGMVANLCARCRRIRSAKSQAKGPGAPASACPANKER